MSENALPKLVDGGVDSPPLSVMDELVWIRMDGAASDGRMAMFVVESQPGNGTPPHVHQREDESFFILQGEYTFTVAGQAIVARAGEALYARRDVPHFYRNTGDAVGRMLVIVTPAGLEDFFRETARALPSVPRSAEELALIGELCEKYGMRVLSSTEGAA